MRETFRKIKRVQPIIKMKQSRVDHEAAILGAIRAEKVKIVQSMKEKQKRYMDGVDELNRIRSSQMRTNLDTLEQALDYVKAEWYKLYKDVQTIEAREKEQITSVLEAERELKAAEKLREKYEVQHRQEMAKSEQKLLDEMALRKFSVRS